MNVYKFLTLEKNKKELNDLRKNLVFSCDFETLSEKNTTTNKYGHKKADIYLWGMATSSNFIWGTKIEDFWNTLELIASKTSLIRNKLFYFVNLSFDYQFFKNLLHSKYKLFEGELIEFLEIKKEYLEDDNDKTEFENYYYMIKSGPNVIAIYILKNGNFINISCAYRKTNMSVKNMQTTLEKNNVKTPKKLVELMDYNIINKVMSREKLYIKVFKHSSKNNFFKSSINNSSECGMIIKYLENDCKIPLIYLNYFWEKLSRINLELNNQQLSFKSKNKYFGLKLVDKDTKKKVVLHKVIIDTTNAKDYLKLYGTLDLKNSIEIQAKDYKQQPIWLYPQSYMFLQRINVGMKVLDTKEFNKIPIKNYFNKYALTLSGLTFTSFKKYYGKKLFDEEYGNYDDNILSDEQYDIINRAFMGGLTNFNSSNMTRKGRVLSIDINSSYPYQMLKPMPYGKPLDKMPKGGIGYVSVNIMGFELKKENLDKVPPFFPKWKTQYKTNRNDSLTNYDERYLTNYHYSNGEFNANFTIDEWNYYLKYYNINYKVVTKFFFKTKEVSNEYISKLKEIKINAKDIGEKNVGKLLMNGLYGKFAQKPIAERYLEINLKDPNIWEEIENLANKYCFTNYMNKKEYGISRNKYNDLKKIFTDPNLLHTKTYSYLTFLNEKRTNFLIKINGEIKEEFYRYRQIAAIITWQARKQLLDLIIQIGWKNIKYFDTDSIYMFWNEETKTKLKALENSKKIVIDDKVLGGWCYEKIMKNMIVLGAKKYQLEIEKKYVGNGKWIKSNSWEYKIAGLKNANNIFEKVGHDKFRDGYHLKNVSLKKKNLDNGAILIETDFVLKKGCN